jgi:hypothetical protein
MSVAPSHWDWSWSGLISTGSHLEEPWTTCVFSASKLCHAKHSMWCHTKPFCQGTSFPHRACHTGQLSLITLHNKANVLVIVLAACWLPTGPLYWQGCFSGVLLLLLLNSLHGNVPLCPSASASTSVCVVFFFVCALSICVCAVLLVIV